MARFNKSSLRFVIISLLTVVILILMVSCQSKTTEEGIEYSYSEIKYGTFERSQIDVSEFKESPADLGDKYEIFYNKKGIPVYAETRYSDMNVCKIYYNEKGKITEIRNYTQNFSYPATRSTFEYNKNGDIIKYSTYQNGYVSSYHTYEYDSDNTLIKSEYYNTDETPEFYTLYDYDEAGNLIRKTQKSYSSGENNNVTEYQYDEANRLTKYIVNDRTQEKYEYDESGRLTTHTHYSSGSYVNSTTYKYEYNEAGQVIKKSRYHKESSRDEEKMELYTAYEYSGDSLIRATTCRTNDVGQEMPDSNSIKEYDLNGNLIYEYGQLGIYRYQYDDRNLCTGVSIEGVCRLERKYDKKGDCTESTVYFPDGEVIESHEGYMTVACANHIYDASSYSYTVSGLSVTKYNEYDQPIYYLYLSLNEDNKFEKTQYTEYQYNEDRNIVKSSTYDMEGNVGGYSEYSYHETTGYIKEEKHFTIYQVPYRYVIYDENVSV